MIKKLLGIEPKLTEDGAFSPSPLSLKLATSDTTDYDGTVYENAYTGEKLKILMLCTEEKNLPMTNGKKFLTGNHPVEMLVPMLHLRQAGFEIDVFTPNGKPAKIEMWAMPEKDKNVQTIYAEFRDRFAHPKSLAKFVQNSMSDSAEYFAVFIPGGHGALLGLPFDTNVGKLVHWAFERQIFMLSICHGPAAFLAASPKNESETFIYNGYKIAAFPDLIDRLTPLIGYMPGQLTWKFGERLKKLGVTIVNKLADKSCYVDRKLITGASPDAANNFGKLAATKLLKSLNNK